MAFIKIEVQEHEEEGYNSVIITPRDDDEDTRRQVDLILHAVMSSSLKRGGAVMGSSQIRIDVKTDDLKRDLRVSI